MKEGKQFETSFQESCKKSNFYFLRIKDSASWTFGKEASFTAQNPYDALLYTSPFIWCLELKSTKGASMSFYPKTPYEKPKNTTSNVMIKAHQVKELIKCSEYEGIIAGLILNFRPRELKKGITENKVYFILIQDFIKFAETTGKSSISEEDCKTLGVEVNGEIKKVHYKYDIKDFINRALAKYVKDGTVDLNFLETVLNRVKKLISVSGKEGEDSDRKENQI